MNRRELVQRMGMFGVIGALPLGVTGRESESFQKREDGGSDANIRGASPLKPPAQGSIPVAFVISKGAVVIDFCGPWAVFETVYVPGREESPFRLYTVSGKKEVIQASGGLKIATDYSFANAPAPKVIVIPAQDGSDQAMLEWIRESSKTADLTMSVCTGAFVLAQTGLLSGKAATTHHSGYRKLAVDFPDVHVKRGARFVETGNLATAGGLSSGIDLALRVVERYFGREAATRTVDQMEYQGQGWLNPDSNNIYAKVPISTEEHPLCPVCEMEVDRKVAPTSIYRSKTYYFCSDADKAAFKANPGKYLESQ